MSKIPRKYMTIFASLAGADQIEKFGSLAAGTPEFTTDPEAIQSLSNYLGGWFEGVVANNSPAIEDMNAICYLYAYQLAYIMQAGIPEWDDATIYYIGSLAMSGGQVFVSLTDNNTNNAVTSTANWRNYNAAIKQTVLGGSSAVVTIPSNVSRATITGRRLFNATAIAPGDNYGNTLINCADGQLVAWGANTRGQLGVNDVAARTVPTQVTGSLPFRYIYVGQGCTFGISSGGTLYAWGYNVIGQLGTGDVTSYSTPNAVLGSQAYRRVQVGGFDGNTVVLGLATTRAMYAWGRNSDGQLGDTTVTIRSSPVAVAGGITFSDEYLSTGVSSYGINTAGALYAWGFNANGELGVGDVVGRSSPVAVLGSHVFSKVYAPTYRGQPNTLFYAMALDTAGALWGWGSNSSGQLGNGNVVPRSSPVVVLGNHTFAQVAIAQEYVLALDTAGAAWAWGLNTNGQLGVGDVAPRSSPVAVLGGLTFTKIYTDGLRSSFAIRADGTAYAWGFNANGQLGDTTVTPRSSPVLCGNTFNFENLYPSLNGYVIAEGNANDGTLYGWGANSANGYLGNNSTAAFSVPQLVFGGRKSLKYLSPQINNIDVSAASYTLDLTKYYAFFGTEVVGQLLDSADVEYRK